MAITITLTGNKLDINGTREVPKGLFGVHHMPMDAKTKQEWGIESVRLIHADIPEQPSCPGESEYLPEGVDHIIDCFFDRYRPALQLTEGLNWREGFRTKIINFCTEAQIIDRDIIVEFWNEPYLNWACNPGTNYDPSWYDESIMVEGGPCTIKGHTDPEPYLEWREKDWFRCHQSKGLIPSYVAIGNNQGKFRSLSVGETFDYRGMTIKKIKRLVPTDVRQAARVSGEWYSGPQNAKYYLEMLQELKLLLQRHCPKIKLIAGWGFHAHQDRWQAWEELFKPIIDENIDFLDGLHEHHYGEDPLIVAADYETICAYAMTRHGKSLNFYNTEAGPNYDPQQPNPYASESRFVFEKSTDNPRLRSDLVALSYFCRDVIHMIQVCPDKAKSRAEHHPHLSRGTELGFKILKTLRGELMEVSSSSPEVMCVASLKGSLLTIALFNLADEDLECELNMNLLDDSLDASVTCIEYSFASEELKLVERPLGDDDKKLLVKKQLPTLIKANLKEHHVERVQIQRQFFASGILKKVDPILPMLVYLPKEALSSCHRCRLKFVQSGKSGSASVEINGVQFDVPTARWVTYIELPVEIIREVNHIVFYCSVGFDIWMCSMECFEWEDLQL